MAQKLGLDVGWALDLAVADDEGMAWDFSSQAKRDKELQKGRVDKPSMLITSPMREPSSALQSFLQLPQDEPRGGQEEVE